MAIYYFASNRLKKLFSSKFYIDETPLHLRLKLANDMVEKYCRNTGLNSSEPKELLISIKLLLFRYYLNHVCPLYFILKSNGLRHKRIIIIRAGLKQLYQFDGFIDIVLPGKYSALGILGLFLKIINTLSILLPKCILRNKIEPQTNIIVLPDGNGTLEEKIWARISQFINYPWCLKKFPKGIFNPISKCTPLNNTLVKQFVRDFQPFNKIPFFLKQFIIFQFHTLYQFIATNPTKIVISFEQSSPYAALLAYVCRLTDRVSVDIAHAPTFGDNYKHVPSKYSLLYGESSVESFQQKDSIVCGKVIAIGAPIVDKSFQKPYRRKEWRNNVLFLPSYVIGKRDFEEITTFDIIRKFIEGFPEIRLTIKPHPTKENPHIDALLPYSAVRLAHSNADLTDLIDDHDVTIIVGWSASGLDVAIREKPLIRLNVFNLFDWFDYVGSGYAANATTYEELRDEFLLIRRNAGVDLNAKKALLDYHYENHGTAGQKMALFLHQLLSEMR